MTKTGYKKTTCHSHDKVDAVEQFNEQAGADRDAWLLPELDAALGATGARRGATLGGGRARVVGRGVADVYPVHALLAQTLKASLGQSARNAHAKTKHILMYTQHTN